MPACNSRRLSSISVTSNYFRHNSCKGEFDPFVTTCTFILFENNHNIIIIFRTRVLHIYPYTISLPQIQTQSSNYTTKQTAKAFIINFQISYGSGYFIHVGIFGANIYC